MDRMWTITKVIETFHEYSRPETSSLLFFGTEEEALWHCEWLLKSHFPPDSATVDVDKMQAFYGELTCLSVAYRPLDSIEIETANGPITINLDAKTIQAGRGK